MNDDFEYQLEQERLLSAQSSGESKGKTYVDAKDGTVYEWNDQKNAYFPKIDDEFIAKYQSNYNYNSDDNSKPNGEQLDANEKSSDSLPKAVISENKEKKAFVSKLCKRDNKEVIAPNWFEVDDDHNTNVYVSNLPLNMTDDQFVELMKKCGLIMKGDDNKLKIKLYRDSDGNIKGDGRCCYCKVESVSLALNILDGYQLEDKTIKVERAKFALKGQYDPSKKPKKRKRDKEKMKKKMDKLFDWRPEKLIGERQKSERTVIIKNMFEPKDFESEPKLILEYRNDLKDECTEKCGEVKRVDIYDCHPEGVAAVTFKEFEFAEQCVTVMNGRYFAGRRLSAHLWDGRTKYKVEETEEEAEKRIQQWDKFLDEDNNG